MSCQIPSLTEFQCFFIVFLFVPLDSRHTAVQVTAFAWSMHSAATGCSLSDAPPSYGLSSLPNPSPPTCFTPQTCLTPPTNLTPMTSIEPLTGHTSQTSAQRSGSTVSVPVFSRWQGAAGPPVEVGYLSLPTVSKTNGLGGLLHFSPFQPVPSCVSC